jgi:flavin reductase (DIM6/NTAB) family NADH-FMN oxidoreductase RutF
MTDSAESELVELPKHMVMPLGWNELFGFMCTARHRTYQNARRAGGFTVTFPRPDQVVLASLTAEPRCEDDAKPSLAALPVMPATRIDGVLLREGYLFLECSLEQVIDGFGVNSLVVGRIIAARADERVLRAEGRDDQDLIAAAPLLAYLSPGRYARIDRSFSFPFPAGFSR